MDVSVLVGALKAERDPKVKERILIVTKLREGLSSCEVAKQHRCSTCKVFYWRDRFEDEGLPGLCDRPKSGRPPEVPSGEMERVRQMVEAKEYTTATEALRLIREETGVKYSLMHVTRLLHNWGFSKQKPGRRHVKAASDRTVRRFKKRLKKPSLRLL